MRKFLMVVLGLTLVSFVPSDAWAIKLTAQQVKDTCGKQLTQSPGGFGCDKKCGTKQCSYGCVTKGPKKDQGCYGVAVIKTGGDTVPTSGQIAPGLLESGAGSMQTGGPAAAGATSRAPAAPGGGMLK